jgi:hypothetical protein
VKLDEKTRATPVFAGYVALCRSTLGRTTIRTSLQQLWPSTTNAQYRVSQADALLPCRYSSIIVLGRVAEGRIGGVVTPAISSVNAYNREA